MSIHLPRPGSRPRPTHPIILTNAAHAALAVRAVQSVLDVIVEHHRRVAARKAAS